VQGYGINDKQILKSISLRLVLSFFLHGGHLMLCQSFDNHHHCHHCHAIVMGGVQLLVTGLGGGRWPSMVTMGCTVAPSVTAMSRKIMSVGIHRQCGD